mgnify:CR=1 FL=1
MFTSCKFYCFFSVSIILYCLILKEISSNKIYSKAVGGPVLHANSTSSISPEINLSTANNTKTSSQRYKTELCRSYHETGLCKYGEKCQFAHGYHEIRSLNRHPKYKTVLCRTYHCTGYCKFRKTTKHFHSIYLFLS